MATPVKRPSGRDEIVDAVLDAAEVLFARSGPAEVSLRGIAAEAGVTYSLLNRHFGTRDELLDQLLARYEDRWRTRIATDADPGGLLDVLISDTTHAGPYLRLLAWMLLTQPEAEGAPEAYRRRVALDPLVPPGAGPESRTDVLAALALTFGWRFFGAFLSQALGVADADVATIHAGVRRRVHTLHRPPQGRSEPGWPVSVKAVVELDGGVVLLRNDRDEWELPGGRLDPADASPAVAVQRECREELGIAIAVGPLAASWVYEPVPGTRVVMIAYACTSDAVAADLRTSAEHRQVGVFAPDELATIELPDGYREAIAAGWLPGPR